MSSIGQSRLLVMVLVVILYLPLIATPTYAQDAKPEAEEPGILFGIVPVGDHPDGYFRDIEVSPGQSTVLQVDLVNMSSVEVSFDVFITNAYNAVNGGFAAGARGDSITGPASWINFEPLAVVLGPGESERVSLTVSVPEGTSPGQYISGMVMSMQDTLAIPGTDQLDQKLSYAISVGILVPGDLTYSFELGQPTFLYESSTISVPIVNTGNHLLQPEGKLRVTDTKGKEIVTADIKMGSIYGGMSTTVGISIPPQSEGGDVLVTLDLTDPSSGYSSRIVDEPLSIAAPAQANPLTMESVTIAPNDEPIVFANVEIMLQNATSQIPATNVTLVVLRDGEEVDSFPLATNQVLLTGKNTYTSRYIPPAAWESGTYTFRLEVFSVEPNGGSQIQLLDEDLDAELVVP